MPPSPHHAHTSSSYIDAMHEKSAPLLCSPNEVLLPRRSPDTIGCAIDSPSIGGWRACSFIIGVEFLERLAYYGVSSNLISYFTGVLHFSTASSAKNINTWAGLSAVFPLVTAFFADACLGRYWTIVFVSAVYVLGLVLVTLSVSMPVLKPHTSADCGSSCTEATSGQIVFFFCSLYMISIGTGGIKPCLEAFGADQFDGDDPQRERCEKSSFFNWWYFGVCAGSLTAYTVLVYIQDFIGWELGFGIPAAAMLIGLLLFVAGSRLYRHKATGKSPFTILAQVLVAATWKWKVKVPSDSNLLYELRDEECLQAGSRRLLHTEQFAFLDKAATHVKSSDKLPWPWKVETSVVGAKLLANTERESIYSDSANDPWKLCTVTQVEEVKLVLRIVPIWMSTLMFGVVIAQVPTLFTKQGSKMYTKVGPFVHIPPASLQAFSTIVVLILLPIYDRIFVPAARHHTGRDRGITVLQRIGVGIFLSVCGMVAAALTETKRLSSIAEHLYQDGSTATMSILWMLPQYLFLGIASVFAMVGEQEFFYDQVPDTMRSIGLALYLLSHGVGSFLSSLLIAIVEKVTSGGGNRRSWFDEGDDDAGGGHLEYFYWLLTALSAASLCAFVVAARFYSYKTISTDSEAQIESAE